jgi:hypothetical protein
MYLLRILEKKKLGSTIPHTRMFECLRSAPLAEIKDNLFKNLYFDEHLQKIGYFTGLDMSKVFYTKQKLRNMSNLTKKRYDALHFLSSCGNVFFCLICSSSRHY